MKLDSDRRPVDEAHESPTPWRTSDAERFERQRWWLLFAAVIVFLSVVLLTYGVGGFSVALTGLFVQVLIASVWGRR